MQEGKSGGNQPYSAIHSYLDAAAVQRRAGNPRLAWRARVKVTWNYFFLHIDEPSPSCAEPNPQGSINCA
jgi:hypothetical protein